MSLSPKSLVRLQDVNPVLAGVIAQAAIDPPVPFQVSEGLRTVERQRQLVRAGASQTMRSRHLTGHAVDVVCLVGGKVDWSWPLYERLAVHVLQVAAEEKVALTWGGSWPRFRDGPHYELDWTRYPA